VLYIVRAIEETAVSTCRRIAAIEQLLAAMTREVREKLPKFYSKELVELLFKQPYCKISFLVEEGLAERRTASRYLSELTRIGVLTSRKEGRDLLFLNHRLMDLLSSGF
jgi:Fic family protein